MKVTNIICPFCEREVRVKGLASKQRDPVEWGRDQLESSGHLGEHVADIIYRLYVHDY